MFAVKLTSGFYLSTRHVSYNTTAFEEMAAADLIKITHVTAGLEIQITEKRIEYIER